MDTIQTSIELICKNTPETQLIYQFGSFGTQYEHSESDLDLAMLTNHKLNNVSRFELAQTIASHIHRDVDLVDLQAASTVLQLQIIHHGQCIYVKDQYAKDHFEMMVYANYARLGELRHAIINDIKKRGSVYGQ